MLDANYKQYDIEVVLTLFVPEEGGRKVGFPSTFNGPHIYLDGGEWLARFTLQDREMLNPGETARVFVTFFYNPHYLLGMLYPNKPFLLHEGYHPIGKGRILSLLNFEKHAEEAKREEEERNAHVSDPSRTQIPLYWERPRHRPRKKK